MRTVRIVTILASVVVAVLAPTSWAASAPELPDPTRLAGDDRYATAAAISREAFAAADTVFIATGESFADALGVGPVAAGLGPVLLTGRYEVPGATRRELERLSPSKIVIVGGTAAISEATAVQLAGYANSTVRVAGDDRYATSAALAEVYDAPPIVVLASGASFPDALAGGALAGGLGVPVLLLPPEGGATPEVQSELCRMDPERTFVLGGTSALSAATVEATDCLGDVLRLAGPDRYATAAAMSWRHEYADTVVLATGADFPDALAGAAFAATRGAPLLLVSSGGVPEAVVCELLRLEPDQVYVLGGRAAIPDEVLDQLRTARSEPHTCPPEPTTTRFVDLGGADAEGGEIVLSDDGGTAWLANPSGNEVIEVDLERRVVTDRFPVGSRPRGMDSTSDGRLVTANRGAQTLTLLDPRDGGTETISLAGAIDDLGMTQYAFDVGVVGGDGFGREVAIVSTVFSGSGYGSTMIEVDLATHQATALRSISNGHPVDTAGDRRMAFVIDANTTGGYVYRYDVTTGEISKRRIGEFHVSLDASDDGSRYLLDRTTVVEDGAIVGTFDWGENRPFGQADVDATASIGWVRVGNALMTVDLERQQPLAATYVPRGRSRDTEPALSDLVVTEDGRRAVLGHPGGLMVVDGLDQELLEAR